MHNHHPSRAIQLRVRIAWVEDSATKLVEKYIETKVLPDQEKKVYWFAAEKHIKGLHISSTDARFK